MKNQLLLFLGVILFMGCVGQSDTNTNDDFNENYEQLKEDFPKYDQDKNEKEFNETYSKENIVTYCIVDMSDVIIKYYLGDDQLIMHSSYMGNWNMIRTDHEVQCVSSSDIQEIQCVPLSEVGSFEEIKTAWLQTGQIMGNCTTLQEFPSEFQ